MKHPRHTMIELIKLNGDRFTLNALMIEQIQSLPDTTLTLVSGKKIVVKTPEKELIQKVTTYYQSIGLVSAEQKRVSEE